MQLLGLNAEFDLLDLDQHPGAGTGEEQMEEVGEACIWVESSFLFLLYLLAPSLPLSLPPAFLPAFLPSCPSFQGRNGSWPPNPPGQKLLSD